MASLRFTGHAEVYLAGVPAHDLTDIDIREIQQREGLTEQDLIASGLYSPVAPEPITKEDKLIGS